jgi:phage I-like protein
VKLVRKVGVTWSTMAIALGDVPPSAFRIFAAGWNESTKGRVLFDEQAASDVMAAYAAHGVDIMIDLEHLSLNEESRNFDPDARGWCRLELRSGELWAVDVKWTPDGQVRLSEKRQRYVSPAFWTDKESGRVTEITNIAITGMPATHNAAPLMAASKRGRVPGRLNMADGLTIEKLPALAEALGLSADAALEDVMAALRAIVMAADGQPQPTEDTPAEEPAANAADAPPAAEKDEEKAAEAMAATARLLRLSGKPTLGASLDEVALWRESHVKLEAEQKKLSQERAALEMGERRGLVVELVKLGVELPATAWEDPLAKVLKPAKRLLDEPLADLRKRTETWRSAKGGKGPSGLTPPKAPVSPEASGSVTLPSGEVVSLNAREVAMFKGRKPEEMQAYAARKAAANARKAG